MVLGELLQSLTGEHLCLTVVFACLAKIHACVDQRTARCLRPTRCPRDAQGPRAHTTLGYLISKPGIVLFPLSLRPKLCRTN